MNWFTDLIMGSGIAHSIIILAVTIAVGLLLGKVKICGVSLGSTWILFVGIIASHFGLVLDPKVQSFVQDFGLVLFVFAIGLQVGPGFFASFKRGGLKLNLLALLIIALEVGITYALTSLSGTKLNTMVGVMSGAVTNTPSLGAAQQAVVDVTGTADGSIAMGYAVAYPMGVLGVIIVMLLLKGIFKADVPREAAAEREIESAAAAVKGAAAPQAAVKEKERYKKKYGQVENMPNFIVIFGGIVLGILLGVLPIKLPGMPQAVKLGLAGGPLIIAILIGYFGHKWHDDPFLTMGEDVFMREIGISLFLAAVGLKAGVGFTETIASGGYNWIFYGIAITMAAIFIVGFIGMKWMKINFVQMIGMISGTHTNPPALAFANSIGEGIPSTYYATVYPLSMFLRIIAAQVMILAAL
ncbi:MAG: hypothetical protein LKK19_05295 [Bacteroidales bacterium]|jgi:AspT/YidE/YbjL antiporter-like protein|nr:hypothetical protein [Bacteroidales bacterium]MCI2122099.1 hypothetical protein [Bacteroidales bacterium]MCI2146330.1 hypothetical protein [Bacteroidales bacterium]